MLISEVAVGINNPSNEFIEIYNPTSSAINLKGNGIKLKTVSSSGVVTNKQLTWIKEVIGPHDYFLFGTGDVGKTFNATYSSASLTGTGGIILTDKNDAVLDELSWGENPPRTKIPPVLSVGYSGFQVDQSGGLATNQSMKRNSQEDSLNSNLIFLLQNSPDPQNSSYVPPVEEISAEKICSKDIYLNKIFPFGDEESVELLNKGAEKCSLKGWSITDAIGYDPDDAALKEKAWTYHRNQFTEDVLIDPDGYASFKGDLYLNDTDDSVKLFDAQKVKTETVAYENAASHKDLNYIIKDGTWKWDEEEKEEATNLSNKIQITELLPHPADGNDEYIELYNGSSDNINLENWSLHDASQSGEYIFSADDSIETKKYFVIYKATYDFSLNDSGDETVMLFDPNKKAISKVSYNGSKKGISYNLNGQAWRWSKFLTPGKENIFGNEPYGTVKIDDDVYVNVYANFSVSTGDIDGEKVTVKWTFGDGHTSSKEKTTHKYDAEGKYEGNVKLSDGSEDVIKNFTVDVGKVPHPKVSIISVNPNPKGVDDFETLTLQNKSKKKINLNGWSIATGWKNLSNHPITEDFEIKAGKKKEITKDFSKFTLNNKQAEIELRYPDGEVAYKLKYKKDKISDDEVYAKVDSKWQWIAPAKTEVEVADAEDVATESAQEESSISVPETIEPETASEPQTEEIPEENIGKFSVRENKKLDIETKILGFKNSKTNLDITLTYASANQPFVLGISTVKTNKSNTALSQKSFSNKIFAKINFYLNTLISNFAN